MQVTILSKNKGALYVALFWLVFFQTIEESGLAHLVDFNYTNPLINICRGMLVIACLISNGNKIKIGRHYLIAYILFCIAFGLDLRNGSTTFFDVFFVAAFASKLDYIKILETYFKAVLLSFIVIVASSILGIMPEYSFAREGGVRRFTLGFQHPNLLSANVFVLVILFVLYRKRKGDFRYAVSEKQIDYIDISVCYIAALFCYLVPNSITETVVLAIMGTFFVILKVRKGLGAREIVRSKIFRSIVIVMIPALALLILYIVVNSRFDLLPNFGTTFSNRLLYAIYGNNEFGISLLGTNQSLYDDFKVSNLLGQDIDCLYIKILLRYGVLLSFYFLYMCIKSIRRYIAGRNNVFVIMFICLAIYSLMENRVLSNSKFAFIFICGLATTEYSNTVQVKWRTRNRNTIVRSPEQSRM